MDDLHEQVELLESSANLSTSIEDVQRAIDLLTEARAKVAAGKPPLTGTSSGRENTDLNHDQS